MSNDSIKAMFRDQQSGGEKASLLDAIKAVAPGLSAGKFFGDIADTAVQKWDQGRAEVAQTLFTEGTAYVPYGPGQNPGEMEPGGPLHGLPEAGKEKEQDRGMEM